MKSWWTYDKAVTYPYGEETSYQKAMAFLDDPGSLIEDWGCGTAWAKRFVVHGTYRGVDGAAGHADIVTDLTTYRSEVDAILLRHVLDHNAAWKTILDNAIASARKKLVVILFVPLQEDLAAQELQLVGGSVDRMPDYAIPRSQFEEALLGVAWGEERIASATQYGGEQLFYLEKLE